MRCQHNIGIRIFKCLYKLRNIFGKKPVVSVKNFKIFADSLFTADIYTGTVTAVFLVYKAYRGGVFCNIFFCDFFAPVCRAVIYNYYIKPVRTFAQERIKAFCQKRLAVVRRNNYTQYLFH